MFFLPAIPLLLALQVQPVQAPSLNYKVQTQHLEAFRKAKNWVAVVDYIDALPPLHRSNNTYIWLDALDHCDRDERVLEICKDLERKGKGELDPVLTHFKGKALSKLGRHAEAMDWYMGIGKRGDPTAYLLACNEAMAIPDWQALQACAEAVLVKEPGNGIYLGIRGEALAKQKRFEEAEPVLKEAVRLAPTRAMSWADLACCCNEGARYQEAFSAADQAVRLDPQGVEGLCNRGRACMGLKRYQDGRNDYAAALALQPKDPALVQNLKMNVTMADEYLAYQRAGNTKRSPKKR